MERLLANEDDDQDGTRLDNLGEAVWHGGLLVGGAALGGVGAAVSGGGLPGAIAGAAVGAGGAEEAFGEYADTLGRNWGDGMANLTGQRDLSAPNAAAQSHGLSTIAREYLDPDGEHGDVASNAAGLGLGVGAFLGGVPGALLGAPTGALLGTAGANVAGRIERSSIWDSVGHWAL